MSKLLYLACFGALLTASLSSSAQVPFEQGDIWRGHYVCAQGKTPASLQVREISATVTMYRIQGVLDFGGGSLPHGAYLVLGDYDASYNTITFEPTSWIYRPEQHRAVGLTATLTESATVLAGRMDDPACGEGYLRRDPSLTPAPSQPETSAGAEPEWLLNLRASMNAGPQELHISAVSPKYANQQRDEYNQILVDAHTQAANEALAQQTVAQQAWKQFFQTQDRLHETLQQMYGPTDCSDSKNFYELVCLDRLRQREGYDCLSNRDRSTSYCIARESRGRDDQNRNRQKTEEQRLQAQRDEAQRQAQSDESRRQILRDQERRFQEQRERQ